MIGKFFTYTIDFFICLIVPPAGLLRIARRHMKNKQNLVKGGEKVLILSGVFMIGFLALVSDAATITNPFTYMYGISAILGIALGLPMLLKGVKYGKYKSAVEDHNLLAVSDIANMVKLPKNTVINDLLQMIKHGFFTELKFDSKMRSLQMRDSAMEKIPSKAVECDSCGAKVTVFEGKQNRCEYCGEPL